MSIGGFGPPGTPRSPPWARFGLVSDPGGLANDVSKAKNVIQFFFPERMLVFLSHGLLNLSPVHLVQDFAIVTGFQFTEKELS